MKTGNRIRIHIIYALILVLGLSVSSCKKDDAPDDLRDIVYAQLAGPWTLGNGEGYIKVDGVNVSANYSGFSLAFDEGSYTTTNAADLFNAQGLWEWVDEEATMVDLDDGKEITIILLNSNRFTFIFNLSEGSGRAGIAGNYEISVVR